MVDLLDYVARISVFVCNKMENGAALKSGTYVAVNCFFYSYTKGVIYKKIHYIIFI